MKNFSFNLEKILDLREYREQETKIELGRAIGVLSEIENNIRSVAEERFRTGTQFSGNGAMIRSYMLYISRLDIEKERLLVEAAKAEQKVEEARTIYLEASRERKVLDKLKEKRAAEYKKFVQAEETKVLDDISSAKYNRLGSGEWGMGSGNRSSEYSEASGLYPDSSNNNPTPYSLLPTP
ncbi:MAG: flagellar export protein FliJ [Treponema sp.]|jgi:flagellar FliJ protein|nr:flagellar export protein FliJ [Treponema sp.]